MILLIDLGNTRIKWAILESQGIRFGGAHAYKTLGLSNVLSDVWNALSDIEGVWIASVAEASLHHELLGWIQSHWRVTPQVVQSQAEYFGVKNRYEISEQLGVDRWLNLIAARAEFKTAFCIVDCGSFLTIDVVDAEGQHLGGYITPGLDMMYAALSHFSQGRLQAEMPAHIDNILQLGISTDSCVMNGCCQTLVHFINQVTQTLSVQFRGEITYILSGGDANLLMPLLTQQYEHRPALIFEGMALLVREKERRR